MTNQDLNAEVERLLNRGIVLGIIWVFGVGSVIALMSGYQAGKLISKNNLPAANKKKVTLCYLIGISGIILWIAAIAIIILFRKSK